MHLLTQSSLLRALGWSLLNSLWQLAFLWLVYVVFTRIFRRASAGARHGFAVLLLGLGSLWTIVTFLFAYFYAGPMASAFQWNMVSFFQSGRQLVDEALPFCSTLYLLILFFLFVRYAKQYFYSRKLIHAGLSRPTPELRVFTEQTARRMGIKKEVRIWFSQLVEAPVTLGSLRPVILVPLATVCNLSTQQVEALVLHELAHIRKLDYLLHLWISVLEALYFFNPFARLLIRSIQKEREHRCDDLVLQFRYDPHVYVSALMTLARSVQSTPRLVLAANGSNDGLLLQRVKRILKLNTAPEPLKGKSILFLCCALFIAGIGLSRPGISNIREKITAAPVWVASVPSKSAGMPIPAQESATISFVSVNMPLGKNKPEPVAAKVSHKKPAHTGSDDENVYDDDAGLDIVQTDASTSGEGDGDLIGYASSVQGRDYSIVPHTTPASPKAEPAPSVAAEQTAQGCPLQAPAPYVPNSSFSFQRIQDSTLPGAQYVFMQQMASRQVEQAIFKMQKELQWQLKVLQQSNTKDSPDLKRKQQIILEQLKLQQQYLEKQQQLQKKLESVGKKRVIVIL